MGAYVRAGDHHVVMLNDDVGGEASLRVPADVTVDVVVANLQLELQTVPSYTITINGVV